MDIIIAIMSKTNQKSIMSKDHEATPVAPDTGRQQLQGNKNSLDLAEKGESGTADDTKSSSRLIL